jgi:XRE family transcriptional regulator, regulator of sulfur utilization
MHTLINEKIRLARLEKGLSQENMASLLFMEQPCYCKIEKGNRELKVAELLLIAKILDKPVTHFFPPRDEI